MNYLAHIYLSGDNTMLRIGNFIADAVRGKDFSAYPELVTQGIILHRKIDTYTDSHPIVTASKDVIRKRHGHWSSVIIDLFYDHFLAANWDQFHPTPLKEFATQFYNDLQDQHDILPTRVQGFLPYMIKDNWLVAYSSIDGMTGILQQMHRRTKYKSDMHIAHHDLIEHYDVLQEQFHVFMKELKAYVTSLIHDINI